MELDFFFHGIHGLQGRYPRCKVTAQPRGGGAEHQAVARITIELPAPNTGRVEEVASQMLEAARRCVNAQELQAVLDHLAQMPPAAGHTDPPGAEDSWVPAA